MEKIKAPRFTQDTIRTLDNWENYKQKRFLFIKKCRKNGMSYGEIAKILGWSKQHIYLIHRYGLNILSAKKKEAIKKRDKNKCRICKRNSKNLHIHHLDNPKDNSKKNLITLCGTCHKAFDTYTKAKKKNI